MTSVPGKLDGAETPPAPPTADQRERRRRVIDAAFELGAERGYDAVQMRDSGYASAEDIDTAMRLGCGLPKGPFEILAGR